MVDELLGDQMMCEQLIEMSRGDPYDFSSRARHGPSAESRITSLLGRCRFVSGERDREAALDDAAEEVSKGDLREIIALMEREIGECDGSVSCRLR